ncbi:MAG: hypothetical protein GWP04_07870 [Gammaproteobacteria bacterium]|nr:hypothetical protein [Gammaproteobacteria bacterium]
MRSAHPTTEQVWRDIERHIFGILAWVTPAGKARSAGIVYTIADRRIYIVTGPRTWKARHIAGNPHVSITVTIPKRAPLMPWIKIPAAAITFHGKATIRPIDEAPAPILHALLRGLEKEVTHLDMCLIEITPVGHFVTYGIGVPMFVMRHPERATARVPVSPR